MGLGRIIGHYGRVPETDRLAGKAGRTIEFDRTKDIVARHLSARGCDVLDVGGGTGHYSFWLASLGHRVTLVDPVPNHVASARARNEAMPQRLHAIHEGEAAALPCAADSFDVVLNLGPMYHLVAAGDRQRALAELRRVMRADAVLMSAYISRFAPLLDGYVKGYVDDPRYVVRMVCDPRHIRHVEDDPLAELAAVTRPAGVAE